MQINELQVAPKLVPVCADNAFPHAAAYGRIDFNLKSLTETLFDSVWQMAIGLWYRKVKRLLASETVGSTANKMEIA